MRSGTFENPVYGEDFPDPFVLKHAGVFWAYATGYGADGNCFPVMRSDDLVAWEPAGSAMAALAERPPCMWAPEVWYEEGRFYLYYSAGNEEQMELRVAVAEAPDGPCVDAGVRLTSEEFAIDAHVFRDRDGAKYLFYATDFLEHTHIGTGVVVDRMRDPLSLEGAPRPVVRAQYEWQVYDPKRDSKGGVCWHTVEGPFVLERDGRYAMMFSGGNWQNESYGVGFATTDRVLADGEWSQYCDGAFTRPVLTSAAGVRGPGHNSVVRGPDNRQLYCVYHYWPDDLRGRVMAIDRLEWVGDRLVILGPTVAPQPAPNRARDLAGLASWEIVAGDWGEAGRALAAGSDATEAVAELRLGASGFLFETTVRVRPRADHEWAVGIGLVAGRSRVATALVTREGVAVEGLELAEQRHYGWPTASLSSARLVRVECSGSDVTIGIDGMGLWRGRASAEPDGLALSCRYCEVTFDAPSVTIGWEERFGDGLAVDGQSARVAFSSATGCESYELVVSALMGAATSRADIYPAASAAGPGPRLSIERALDSWDLALDGDSIVRVASHAGSLLVTVRKRGAEGEISVDGRLVARVSLPGAATHVGIGGRGGVGYDLVRLTELWPPFDDSEAR